MTSLPAVIALFLVTQIVVLSFQVPSNPIVNTLKSSQASCSDAASTLEEWFVTAGIEGVRAKEYANMMVDDGISSVDKLRSSLDYLESIGLRAKGDVALIISALPLSTTDRALLRLRLAADTLAKRFVSYNSTSK